MTVKVSFRPIAAAIILAVLPAWLGLRLVKFNYPDALASAKDVPSWLVDGHFDRVSSADLRALRGGQCSHDPISVRMASDGSGVLICGIPAQFGPVRLFVVDQLDPTFGFDQDVGEQ